MFFCEFILGFRERFFVYFVKGVWVDFYELVGEKEILVFRNLVYIEREESFVIFGVDE